MLSFKKELNVISTKNKLINIVIFIATLSTQYKFNTKTKTFMLMFTHY